MSSRAVALQSVALAWTRSDSPVVSGYRLYYGSASGNYTNAIAVGNATNTVISGLAEGKRYFFVVTACDSLGLESAPSGEVSYLVPDRATLVLQALEVDGITTGVIITATGAVPYRWALESSPDLQTWTTLTRRTNAVVNVTSPVAAVPTRFFRLKSE